MKILIHNEIFDDIKLCCKKWYPSLKEEVPRVCRLLMQDSKISGETPYHYIKLKELQGKIFHAGIPLPKEGIGKLRGGRITYVKESCDLIKILYVGGHKDERYNNSHVQVPLLEKRYSNNNFIEYSERISFVS